MIIKKKKNMSRNVEFVGGRVKTQICILRCGIAYKDACNGP